MNNNQNQNSNSNNNNDSFWQDIMRRANESSAILIQKLDEILVTVKIKQGEPIKPIDSRLKTDLPKVEESSAYKGDLNHPLSSDPIVNPIDHSTDKTVFSQFFSEFLVGNVDSFFYNLPKEDRETISTTLNHCDNLIKNRYEILEDHKNENLLKNEDVVNHFNNKLMPSRNSVFLECLKVFHNLRDNSHLDSSAHIALSKD